MRCRFLSSSDSARSLVPPELHVFAQHRHWLHRDQPGNRNDLPQNPYNLRADRGLSNYDVRNYFVAYWNWDLPPLPGPKLLGTGWHWNTITTLSSGNPFSAVISFDRARALPQSGTAPETPNLAPGGSTNPIIGDPARYFDPSSFVLQPAGFYGNLGAIR